MLKLFRYLKGAAPVIALIILLLALQAVCDLTLPEYTSRIVDTGIQQGGVESPVFGAVSRGTMEKMLLVIPGGEGEELLRHYELSDKNNLSAKDYGDLSAKYPLLKSESIYIKRAPDDGSLDALSDIFTRAATIVTALDSDLEQVEGFSDKIKGAFPPGTAPENATIYELLALMPREARAAFLKAVDEQMDMLPELMTKQLSISLVRREYEALGVNTDSIQNRFILLAGLKMLSLALLAAAATVAVTFLSARIAAGLGRDLRHRVFTRVMSFSNREMDSFSTASLITRSTNDIQQVQLVITMLFRFVIYAPILGFGGLFRALGTNSSMSWIIGLALLVILVLVSVLYTVGIPRFKRIQTLIDKLNLVSREILTGLPVIRAFNNERHEEERFETANKALMRTTLFVNRLMSLMMPVMMFVMNGVAVLIVYVGAGYIDSGDMQVGSMMAFIQYTMQIVMAFLMLSAVSIMLPRASVSAKRILEILETEPEIKDPENPQRLDASKGPVLEFQDVSFRYPGAEEDALSHISFTARAGQTTAVVGGTGSGKSTLVQLIPRFYDVTGGGIYFYGTDIRAVSLRDLRDQVGFVPQKAVLFSGTVASNLRYGRQDAGESELERAAGIAQAMDFIRERDGAMEGDISQGGSNVSGGQKQRLSIARAIVKRPALYVFDDSFSAIDYKTDAALRKALKKVTGDSAVLIVAQRISTVMHADQIVVLNEGKMVGRGTHAKLMESCEVYRQIALSQLSKEELA